MGEAGTTQAADVLMTAETNDRPSLTLTFRSPHFGLLILGLLATAVLFSNLWIGDLGLDSCAYATISRAMLRTHDWLVPHYEHCREYADCWLHPPLFYWLTALSFKAFGITEFAARFVAALLGLGTVLLAYGIGSRVGGSVRAGFFSGFVLVTTQPFLELGRKCQIDVPLAFFISLTVYFFVLGRTKKNGWVFDALAGGTSGLALLTKGVPAAGMLVLVVLYAVIVRDWKFFRPSRLGLFFLAMAMIVGIWIVPLAHAGELTNFLRSYFVDQIWGNFSGGLPAANPGVGSFAAGFFWYLGALARRYWPWLPFLVIALFLAVKSWRKRKEPILFLLWLLIVIAGFSGGGTKFYRYLAPAYPAAALLIGVVLGERATAKTYRGFLYGTGILALAVLVVTSVTPLSFGRIAAPDRTELKTLASYIQAWTPPDQPVATFGIGYWSAVAEFAFYADRSVQTAATEDELAASLRAGATLGYLETRAYRDLSEAFRAEFVPLVADGRFTIIADRAMRERLIPEMIPFIIR